MPSFLARSRARRAARHDGPPPSAAARPAWQDAPALRPSAVGIPTRATDPLGFGHGLVARGTRPILRAPATRPPLTTTASIPITAVTPVAAHPGDAAATPPSPTARTVQRLAAPVDTVGGRSGAGRVPVDRFHATGTAPAPDDPATTPATPSFPHTTIGAVHRTLGPVVPGASHDGSAGQANQRSQPVSDPADAATSGGAQGPAPTPPATPSATTPATPPAVVAHRPATDTPLRRGTHLPGAAPSHRLPPIGRPVDRTSRPAIDRAPQSPEPVPERTLTAQPSGAGSPPPLLDPSEQPLRGGAARTGRGETGPAGAPAAGRKAPPPAPGGAHPVQRAVAPSRPPAPVLGRPLRPAATPVDRVLAGGRRGANLPSDRARTDEPAEQFDGLQRGNPLGGTPAATGWSPSLPATPTAADTPTGATLTGARPTTSIQRAHGTPVAPSPPLPPVPRAGTAPPSPTPVQRAHGMPVAPSPPPLPPVPRAGAALPSPAPVVRAHGANGGRGGEAPLGPALAPSARSEAGPPTTGQLSGDDAAVSPGIPGVTAPSVVVQRVHAAMTPTSTPPAPATTVDTGSGADSHNSWSRPSLYRVQRVEASSVEPPPPSPDPAASTVEPAAPPGGASGELPPELADQLYTKIERRLRMELLLDRERRAALHDAPWDPVGR